MNYKSLVKREIVPKFTHESSLEMIGFGSSEEASPCARYTSRTESHGAFSSITSSRGLDLGISTAVIRQ